MASSRGMAAPGVVLPTVPSMPTSSVTKGTRPSSTRAKVVKVPKQGLHVKGAVKAPKIHVVKPKMPKDAHRLNVPAHKRLRSKPFQIPKRKPVV